MTPWRITIDTNPDLCNLNCIMCDTHSKFNSDFKYRRKNMSLQLLTKAVLEAKSAGVKEIIPTTMGEPLLYPHFEEFLKLVSDNNMKLNLTTNGSFPAGGIEKWADILVATSSDIKVSINALDSVVNENIMQGSNTKQVLRNIDQLVEIRDGRREKGLPATNLTLQLTFMKSNLEQIEDLVIYAAQRGIDRVKGHQLWITWPELQSESLRHDLVLTNKWNDLVVRLAPYRSKIRLENFDPIEIVKDHAVVLKALECPFLGKELWIDYDGSYNVCCCPSEVRKQLGNFGNIKDKSIQELFDSAQYEELKEGYKSNSVCKSCPLRRTLC